MKPMSQAARIRRLNELRDRKRKWQEVNAEVGKRLILLESQEAQLIVGCTHRDGDKRSFARSNGIDTWCLLCGVTNSPDILAVAGLKPGIAKARPRLRLVHPPPSTPQVPHKHTASRP